MKVTVSRQELKAALLFASTDETRFIITGVNIEVRKEKRQPVVVATDGRRLVAIETVAEQSESFEQDHQLLIRPDFIDVFHKLSKACGGKLYPWISIENKPGSKRVHVEMVGANVSLEVENGALIEGQYPNWRACMPARKSGVPIKEIGLNAAFVGDFSKAAKILECESAAVQMNLVGKEQQIEVKIRELPNFYGLLMQCKVDESAEYQPEFTQIVKAFPKQEPDDEKEGD